MKKTYLYILWQQNKPIFIFVLLFIIGQLFFTFKQVETVPFFNYGMYSSPALAPKVYSTVAIYYDKNRLPLKTYTNESRFLQYQLAFYASLLKQDSVDWINHTIDKRFGNKSGLSTYLKQYLSNSKQKIEFFPSFVEAKLNKSKLIFCEENYEWVKNKFTLVNKTNLANAY